MFEHPLLDIVDQVIDRPYLRKYVRKNLTSTIAAVTPRAHEVLAEMQRAMRMGGHPVLDLGLDLPPITSPHVLSALNANIRRMWMEEMCRTVDQLHYGIRQGKFESIRWFRDLYDITEDDYPELSTIREYQRYEEGLKRPWRKTGRCRRMGAAPKPEPKRRRFR